MHARTFLIIVVSAAVLAASGLTVPSVTAGPAGAGGKAESSWRVLVYLDADNSLDVYAGAHHEEIVQVDLDELMAVGSTRGVDVFVLVDRVDGPARLYKVLPGSLQEQTAWAGNGKEANMGDPATLRSFVAYTFRTSKAPRTWLTFWDHGSPDYVAWDDHPGTLDGHDALTHWEVVRALDGYRVDVVAADECLVGQIEVAYEYAAAGLEAEFLVASEGYTGWRGFPYDRILADLAADPDMDARALAIAIVDETDAYLSKPPYMGEVVNSHSAIDLARMGEVATAIRGLTGLLIPDMKSYAGIVTAARGSAQVPYGNAALSVIDLPRFLQGIAEAAASAEIRAAGVSALDILAHAVAGVQATQATERMAGGLGIYLPTVSWDVAWYERYAFAGQGWLAFLEAYWAAHGA